MNARASGRLSARPDAVVVISWVALVASGVLEAVWAHALAQGLGHLTNLAFFVGGLAGSVSGLWFAMRSLPMGTSYAVWSGVGAATTAAWAMWLGEPVSGGTLLCLAAIIAGIVGLQLTTPPAEPDARSTKI